MIDKKATLKQQAKSKLNWVGAALPVLMFVQANFPRLEAVLKEHYDIVFIVLGGIIIILRQVTTKPVSEK